jgi:hypothetical protein
MNWRAEVRNFQALCLLAIVVGCLVAAFVAWGGACACRTGTRAT